MGKRCVKCWSVAGIILLCACARSEKPLVRPGVSTVALTGGPNKSMVYLARTSDGIVAIDLGWWGSTREISRRLRELGTSPKEVRHVFLTHSHRDHIGAWRLVRGSQFYLSQAELPRLIGGQTHEAWIPRLAEQLKPSELPHDGDLRVLTFSRDTVFVLGRDTLFAFVVPGHTAGSAAYLFRGVLFLGDAATFSRFWGFGPARRGYTDNRALAVESLRRLWSRLPSGSVHHVCTAHAHCRAYTPSLLEDINR